MAMRLPLMARRSAVGIVKRSRPSNSTSPEVISAGGMSSRFITAAAETDLPEPLSPRMASVSPRSRYQLMFLTAFTTPVAIWKRTDRFLTSSRCASAILASDFQPPALGRIERDAQPVRHEVERQRGEDDGEARPEGEPPGAGQIR